ncbi:MAG: hypothetical protein IJK61_06900, partial [Bacteroidetes bacterium]|nr:hypothetical protein [Bacteroidota bacterium]
PNDTTLGCDWSNIPWDTYVVDYDTLTEFPDCPIIVSYRVRSCPNNPLIRQIDILNIFIDLANYTNCKNLYNYLYTGSSEEQAIHYQEIKEKIYFSLSQREAEQMADLPPCDSLGNYLPQTVFYKEQACKSIVTFNCFDSNNDTLYSIPIEVVCNREVGCCKTTFSFCQDSLGNTNPQITKELIGIDCSLAYPVELDYEEYFIILATLPGVRYVTADPSSCFSVCH